MESKLEIQQIDTEKAIWAKIFGLKIGDIVLIADNSNILKIYRGKKAVIIDNNYKIRGSQKAFKLCMLEGVDKGRHVFCFNDKQLTWIGRGSSDEDAITTIRGTN